VQDALQVGLHDASHEHSSLPPHPLAPHCGVVTKVQPPTWVAQLDAIAVESGRKDASTSGVDEPPCGACVSARRMVPIAWGGPLSPPPLLLPPLLPPLPPPPPLLAESFAPLHPPLSVVTTTSVRHGTEKETKRLMK
jgi:hypothetical protein